MLRRYYELSLAAVYLVPGYLRTGGFSRTSLANSLIALRWLRNTSRYYWTFGRYPNYLRPTGLSEKMQWRKLFDRNPLFATFLDKVKVRDYVTERAPEVRLPELYWHGADLEAMPLDTVPVPCVIKPNNRSGAVIFARTRNDLDRPRILEQCRAWLDAPAHGRRYAEWGYAQVPSQVLIEEFLSEDGADLVPPTQYDFYVFGGRVKYISVSVNSGMATGNITDLYSPDWERLPLRKWTYRRRLSGYGETRPRPKNLAHMIRAAERLGAGVDHVRVDFYNLDGVLYLAEMTLYTSGGFYTWVPTSTEFNGYPPRRCDDEFGADWNLPDLPTGSRWRA